MGISISAMGMKLLKTVGIIDDVRDVGALVGNAMKNRGNSGEGDQIVKRGPTQEHLVEAAIIDITAPYIMLPPDKRDSFLTSPKSRKALKRVTEDFYGHCSPSDKDLYEKVLGQQPWYALCDDGLGTRRQPQQAQLVPQQKKGQRGQQPVAAQTPDMLDSSHLKLYIALKVCLGLRAMDADNFDTTGSTGDAVIMEGIQRIRQASAGEKAQRAAVGTVGFLADLLETINDELETP